MVLEKEIQAIKHIAQRHWLALVRARQTTVWEISNGLIFQSNGEAWWT
jgi:hypothetical protein